jgi:hypothetical protein
MACTHASPLQLHHKRHTTNECRYLFRKPPRIQSVHGFHDFVLQDHANASPHWNMTSSSSTLRPWRNHSLYIPPWTGVYNSSNSRFAKTATPSLVDTLKGTTWYATLTILTTCIQEGIHMNNTNNLLEQCHVSLMYMHACMQPNHLISI